MPPELRGRRVALRPVADGDAGPRRDAGNPEAFSRNYGGPSSAEPFGLGTARRWVERVRGREPHSWVIDLGGLPVGELYLHSFDMEGQGTCYLSMGIFREDLWGQGLGRDALAVALDWAFGEAGRSAVFLRVRQSNARALRCYATAGFRECRRDPAALDALAGPEGPSTVLWLRSCDRVS